MIKILYRYLVVCVLTISCSGEYTNGPTNVRIDSTNEAYMPTVLIIEGLSEGQNYDIQFPNGSIQGYAVNDSQLIYTIPGWESGLYTGTLVVNEITYGINVDVKAHDDLTNSNYAEKLVDDLTQIADQNDPEIKSVLEKYNSLNDEEKKIADAIIYGFSGSFNDLEKAINEFNGINSPMSANRISSSLVSNQAITFKNDCSDSFADKLFLCLVPAALKLFVAIELYSRLIPGSLQLKVGLITAGVGVLAVDIGFSLAAKKSSWLLGKASEGIEFLLKQEFEIDQDAKPQIVEVGNRNLSINFDNFAAYKMIQSDGMLNLEADSIYDFTVPYMPWRYLQAKDAKHENDDISSLVKKYIQIHDLVLTYLNYPLPSFNNDFKLLTTDSNLLLKITDIENKLKIALTKDSVGNWKYKFTKRTEDEELEIQTSLKISFQYQSIEVLSQEHKATMVLPKVECDRINVHFTSSLKCELDELGNEILIGRYEINSLNGEDISYLSKSGVIFNNPKDLSSGYYEKIFDSFWYDKNAVDNKDDNPDIEVRTCTNKTPTFNSSKAFPDWYMKNYRSTIDTFTTAQSILEFPANCGDPIYSPGFNGRPIYSYNFLATDTSSGPKYIEIPVSKLLYATWADAYGSTATHTGSTLKLKTIEPPYGEIDNWDVFAGITIFEPTSYNCDPNTLSVSYEHSPGVFVGLPSEIDGGGVSRQTWKTGEHGADWQITLVKASCRLLE